MLVLKNFEEDEVSLSTSESTLPAANIAKTLEELKHAYGTNNATPATKFTSMHYSSEVRKCLFFKVIYSAK
jgi:hypothetical protein